MRQCLSFFLTLLIAIATMVPVGTAWAQSALERLEQQIRKRNPSSAGDNSPAEQVPASPSTGETTSPPTPPAQEPAYLGFVVDDLSDRGRGVRVLAIHPGSPAEKAGIRKQDLVTGMAGVRVRQMTDFSDILEEFAPGDSTTIDILRDEKKETVKITFGRRDPQRKPQPSPAAPQVISSPPADLLPEPPEQPTGPVLAPPKKSAEAVKKPATDIPQPADQLAGPSGSGSPKTAEAPKDPQQRIEQLQRRVAELEQRVAELEQELAEAKK